MQGVGIQIRGVPYLRASNGGTVTTLGPVTGEESVQKAREGYLTGAVAPKTGNQGQEVLESPITWVCLPLAKPSWKGEARASSSHSAQRVQGEQPRTLGGSGKAGEPVCSACTVSAHTGGRRATFPTREGAALGP